MTTPISSPVFGAGEIRNANTTHRFAVFSDKDKPQLFIWPDNSFTIRGYYSAPFGSTVDAIDEVVAEIKRLALRVKEGA